MFDASGWRQALISLMRRRPSGNQGGLHRRRRQIQSQRAPAGLAPPRIRSGRRARAASLRNRTRLLDSTPSRKNSEPIAGRPPVPPTRQVNACPFFNAGEAPRGAKSKGSPRQLQRAGRGLGSFAFCKLRSRTMGWPIASRRHQRWIKQGGAACAAPPGPASTRCSRGLSPTGIAQFFDHIRWMRFPMKA
jgi:hypothetical protein